ncbi:hypothetical protein D3C72_1626640 [compost metagenome]
MENLRDHLILLVQYGITQAGDGKTCTGQNFVLGSCEQNRQQITGKCRNGFRYPNTIAHRCFLEIIDGERMDGFGGCVPKQLHGMNLGRLAARGQRDPQLPLIVPKNTDVKGRTARHCPPTDRQLLKHPTFFPHRITTTPDSEHFIEVVICSPFAGVDGVQKQIGRD